VYGVTSACPFSCLSDFDVTQFFAPDVMHDVLEGVVPLTVKHILRHTVASTTLSVQDINHRLMSLSFKYGKETYLPPPLSLASVNGDGQISGNASEKWCLLRILPFLLNGACTGVVWETYEYLRHVTDIVWRNKCHSLQLGFGCVHIRLSSDFCTCFSTYLYDS